MALPHNVNRLPPIKTPSIGESDRDPKLNPLIDYFRSGWVFFMPYLVVYLFYTWKEWPVNPPAAPLSSSLHPPSLIAVYWFLHSIHLVLAAITLFVWLRISQAATHPRQGVASFLPIFCRIFPWICLTLLFWIPGVFREFPADSWEHYSRINEWSDATKVSDHSYWMKFGYFLCYSIIGRTSAYLQFVRLDLYYIGACMLLCWQYFRLARTVGLKPNAAFIFVLLQTLLFGNNLFSFYRYYGISTALFAQLGAVALIRIGLEILPSQIEFGKKMLRLLFAALCIIPFIAFNHVQGLGIAALGIAAIGVWRLILWRRSTIGWLVIATIAINLAALLWCPRHPAIDEVFRPQGWMTAWYGFNIFSPLSIAGDRTIQIVGVFGTFNFIAGAFLLGRNHPVGWLTVMPILALNVPFVAIPFANALAGKNIDYIMTFHRLLFGIPAGLALVVFISSLPGSTYLKSLRFIQQPRAAVLIFVTILGILVITPPSGPFYNRLWNAYMIPPNDLCMSDVGTPAIPAENDHRLESKTSELICPRAIGVVAYASGTRGIPYDSRARTIFPPNIPSVGVSELMASLAAADTNQSPQTVLLTPKISSLYTPGSVTGFLSTHWSPNQVALGYAGIHELQTMAQQNRGQLIEKNRYRYYLFFSRK